MNPDRHVTGTLSIIPSKIFLISSQHAYGMNWLMYGSIYHGEEFVTTDSRTSFYLA
jgi:hypothetical protein